jgi:hypothetical protein
MDVNKIGVALVRIAEVEHDSYTNLKKEPTVKPTSVSKQLLHSDLAKAQTTVLQNR